MIRAAAAGALVLGLATSAFGAGEFTPVERVWYAQGWTHPILVHIPIGVFMAGAVAALLRVVFRRIPISIVYYCLLIGALGAIPTALAGWAWAPQKNSAYVNAFEFDNDLFWHRWGGIAVTAASLFVLVWATQGMRRRWRYERLALVAPAGRHSASVSAISDAAVAADAGTVVTPRPAAERVGTVELKVPEKAPNQFWWQFAVVLLAFGMGWVGHEGGELVYVDNFKKIVQIATGEMEVPLKGQKKSAAASAAVEKTVPATLPADRAAPTTQAAAVEGAGTAAAAAATPVTSAGGKIDFHAQIWPIFQEKCIYCHGPDKAKGKLRMDSEAAALKGGSDDGPLYIAGNASESPLIVRSHSDDEDVVMPPPNEDKPISVEELKLMTQWINEGAVWNRPAE